MHIEHTAPGVNESLNTWLEWLETIHPISIDMGLERVARVADRLQLRPVSTPLILVAGTNGKGSTVAMLSAIYAGAGYRVGVYTSPHINHFCERIRINGEMVGESDVVKALAVIEDARAPQSLTYFEYTTLAAMQIFMQASCDVVVLEVGLGGRLDATNIWDADCAIVTSIALDHQEYLGSNIDIIATEKAAVGRRGKPLIVGDQNPPGSLFGFSVNNGFRLVHVGAQSQHELPETGMVGAHQKRNAGCAVAAVRALQEKLPVNQETMDAGLISAFVGARFERANAEGVSIVMDVAHNPASAHALCKAWQSERSSARCEIIFAVMSDKDVGGIVRALSPIVACWHCLGLSVGRAASAEQLADIVRQCTESDQVKVYDDAAQAWQCASEAARINSRQVLVSGSFHTISAVQGVISFEA